MCIGDESWANQETNFKYSYIHDCGNNLNCWVCTKIKELGQTEKLKTKTQKRGKGKRHMFGHIISVQGLLNGFAVDSRGNKTDQLCCNLSKEEGDNMDIEQPTAELVMECGKNKGDYHQNMDGDLYLKYLRNRIIPAFKSRFGKKKLILTLDCAPYHHTRTGFPSVSDDKATIAEWYDYYEIKKIKVRRFGKHGLKGKIFHFGKTKFLVRAPGGASKNEFLVWLHKWCKKNEPEAVIRSMWK